MAALRAGIKTVIIPKDNEKDLQEIDGTVRRALNFLLVDHVDSVISAALNAVEEAEPLPQSKKSIMPVVAESTTTKAGIRQ
mgnify:CR=1 FL=1